MESRWNVWMWLVGVVSRRRVWLVGVGGIYGCGCKEVYRFPHTTYPYSSCICSFFSSIPTLPNRDFLFTRCVHTNPLYSDVIHLFDWKLAIEHDGGI